LSQPGELLDPDEQRFWTEGDKEYKYDNTGWFSNNYLSDNGINSSFSVQILRDNKPVSNVKVDWTSSDASANIQEVSPLTDINGVSRIWYLEGEQQSQTISVNVQNAPNNLSTTLERKSPIKKVFGRAIGIGVVPMKGNYTTTEINARINTDARGIYYALAVYPGFYTGFQNIDCNIFLMSMENVCKESRGVFRGKEAHFSVWDEPIGGGVYRRPILIEKTEQTICRLFEGEGTGLMCAISFDWQVHDNLSIRIQVVPGAPTGYQRVRVEGLNLSTGFSTLLAVIDKGGSVSLDETFFMFNENFLPINLNCFSVPSASITVKSVRLIEKSGVLGKIVSGRSDSPPVGQVGGTQCHNYGVINSDGGIEIFSGGRDRWVEIKPALEDQGGKFQNEWMAVILKRPISVEILNPHG
jgi:hypothetical protein